MPSLCSFPPGPPCALRKQKSNRKKPRPSPPRSCWRWSAGPVRLTKIVLVVLGQGPPQDGRGQFARGLLLGPERSGPGLGARGRCGRLLGPCVSKASSGQEPTGARVGAFTCPDPAWKAPSPSALPPHRMPEPCRRAWRQQPSRGAPPGQRGRTAVQGRPRLFGGTGVR